MTTKGDIVVPSFTGPPLGRPKMELVAAASRPVGRPKGEAARMAELKERLLGTSGTRVMDKMIRIALDDTHPEQTTMLKFLGSRIVPEVAFSGIKAGTGSMSIHFHMMGSASAQSDAIDVPFVVKAEEDPNGT